MLILEKIHMLPTAEVGDLEATGRGTEGFGSTGVIGNAVREEKPVYLFLDGACRSRQPWPR